jgi:hypothetical protein
MARMMLRVPYADTMDAFVGQALKALKWEGVASSEVVVQVKDPIRGRIDIDHPDSLLDGDEVVLEKVVLYPGPFSSY